MKFYLLTLGCPKNQVDAEFMSARLTEAGHTSCSEPRDADLLIVNTCSFIEPARAEAVEVILDLLPYKKPHGKAEYLILTGCLPQMIGREIFKALPEVDAILGTAEYGLIVETVSALIAVEWPVDRSPQGVGGISHLCGTRVPASQQYAWLKISEGCSNHCTYCTIPSIRGPQISRSIEDIRQEALSLAARGVQEIILIAQDTTRYGTDIYGKPALDLLLQELDSKLPSDIWIRMMYFYADSITDNLIDTIAQSVRILNYIDLPIQHASNTILKRMGRLETSELIKGKIALLRSKLPGLILRTTVMVGFPGETEADIEILLNLMEEIRFDRLGCFIFSPEAGTPAARLTPKISSDIAQNRYDRVMLAQSRIELAKSQERIGTITDVIFSDYQEGDILYQGRSYGEAPDVDPVIWVASTVPDLDLNRRYPVRIVEADHYSLVGVTEYEYCE
jgi:ribosomal protein S12 methylthiotransferase